MFSLINAERERERESERRRKIYNREIFTLWKERENHREEEENKDYREFNALKS